MKLFKYIPNSNLFDSILLKESDRNKRSLLINGVLQKDQWLPIEVENISVSKKGDFPSLYQSIPVFSQRALDLVISFLGNEVFEPLPIKINNDNFYIINVLEIIDCLDKEKSILSFNEITGKVASIQKYILDERKILGKHFFKIPETKGLEVIVSEEFKRFIESNKLEGLNLSNILYNTD